MRRPWRGTELGAEPGVAGYYPPGAAASVHWVKAAPNWHW